MIIDNYIEDELKKLEKVSEFNYNVIEKSFELSYSLFFNLGKYNIDKCKELALDNVVELLLDYRGGE